MSADSTTNELPTAQVLIVDDEPDHAEVMAEVLRRLGHVCTLVHDLPGALDELKHGQFDLIVTDLKMQGETDGMEVLAAARQSQQAAETIMVTAHGDIPTAKQAIKGGAYEFIEKPIDLDVLRTLCTRALETVFLRAQNTELRSRVDEQFGFEGIIGQSPAMREVIAKLKQAAPTNIPVLITGESGTGKELFAQAIHNNSPRNKKRFVPLNCAGLTENLLEDELFGHVRGAFTDAAKDREGRFEYANGGTLFLDEIGDMPAEAQTRLLRALQSGRIRRVGGRQEIEVNVRIIAATNRDLMPLIASGVFREDLFYRLNVVPIELPPLRDRPEDIEVLANHFLAQAVEEGLPRRSLAPDALEALQQHSWRGNVRELRNVIVRLAVMARDDVIDAGQLDDTLVYETGRNAAPLHLGPPDFEAAVAHWLHQEDPAHGTVYHRALAAFEKPLIEHALSETRGNQLRAAKLLGINRNTLRKRIGELGVEPDRFARTG